MPDRRHVVAQSWTIRSVFVRTRDGADRLDHAYRRLTTDPETGGE